MKPRPIVPRRTYLVTRRCCQRLFLLLPTRKLNAIVRYCLAYAAKQFSIRLHAFCFLSNHFHIVLTDPLGLLPKFMQWLNGTLARCLNAYHGKWDHFWESGRYSAVRLVDQFDILEKMVYTLANPVAAGLVSTGEQWLGVRSSTLREGTTRTVVEKPDFFFRKKGPLPQKVELVVERPLRFHDLDDEAFGELFERTVAEREEGIRARFRRQGRKFLGQQAILKQSPFDAPHSHAPRRGLNPRVAARDKWARIEALQSLKQFQVDYREALKKYLSGMRDVIFPAGTYLMRVRFGVRCYAPT